MINRLLSLGAWFALFCALVGGAGCAGLGKADSPGGGTYIPGGTGTAGSSGGLPPTAPVSNAGDKYKAVGTNPFVTSAYDPLSTFAVDVDTASYDIFRRDVNLGQLPQPASVRLEEYVNDFKYD